MAQKVIWSQAASDDLQGIVAFIERDSPRYAAAVADKIVRLARALPQFPRIGRMVPEYGRDDIRERFVYSYRLMYQISDDAIVVLAIIHGRQHYEPDPATVL